MQRCIPFKGVPEIAHMVRVGDVVFGINSACTYFVYDYKTQRVLYQEDLRSYGGVVRQGMTYKHGVIYLLLSEPCLQSILRITRYNVPQSFLMRQHPYSRNRRCRLLLRRLEGI